MNTKYDYNELLLQFPERLKIVGNIEYVQNPYFSDKPIIKIDRNKKEAYDTECFEIEEL